MRALTSARKKQLYSAGVCNGPTATWSKTFATSVTIAIVFCSWSKNARNSGRMSYTIEMVRWQRLSEFAKNRTLSRLSTAYDPITKWESGAYLSHPDGPSSSVTIDAQLTAEE